MCDCRQISCRVYDFNPQSQSTCWRPISLSNSSATSHLIKHLNESFSGSTLNRNLPSDLITRYYNNAVIFVTDDSSDICYLRISSAGSHSQTQRSLCSHLSVWSAEGTTVWDTKEHIIPYYGNSLTNELNKWIAQRQSQMSIHDILNISDLKIAAYHFWVLIAFPRIEKCSHMWNSRVNKWPNLVCLSCLTDTFGKKYNSLPKLWLLKP